MTRLYFDTVMFGESLDYLVDRVGEDHVLLGTDYAFDMGVSDPIERIVGVKKQTPAARAKITGLNAARLLRLDT